MKSPKASISLLRTKNSTPFRLPAVEPEETAQTRVDQLNRVIRLMVDCITKMRLTGPPDKEIAVLLRAAADELDQ
jgi:hypothetical protein